MYVELVMPNALSFDKYLISISESPDVNTNTSLNMLSSTILNLKPVDIVFEFISMWFNLVWYEQQSDSKIIPCWVLMNMYIQFTYILQIEMNYPDDKIVFPTVLFRMILHYHDSKLFGIWQDSGSNARNLFKVSKLLCQTTMPTQSSAPTISHPAITHQVGLMCINFWELPGINLSIFDLFKSNNLSKLVTCTWYFWKV